MTNVQRNHSLWPDNFFHEAVITFKTFCNIGATCDEIPLLTEKLKGLYHLQDVDMIWTGMTITAMRQTVVDFSYPYWEERAGMLTSTLPEDPFYIFRPLHTYVWLAFLMVALVSALVVRCVESGAFLLGTVHGERTFTSLWTNVWFFIRAFWSQGKHLTYIR